MLELESNYYGDFLQFQFNYSLSPREEIPLRRKFDRVSSGLGNYFCDTIDGFNEDLCVEAGELGGNYQLVGWERDSISLKVRDFSWVGYLSMYTKTNTIFIFK